MTEADARGPFTAPDGTEFPCKMVLEFADGTKYTYMGKGPKPAKSGKMNAYFGGKMTGDDGSQFQVGCNVTQLD